MDAEARIYLTGFMGSGKTTVGRGFARAGGYAFVDLDERIATIAGRSVTHIFEHQGEASFRDFETRALNDVSGMQGAVISLGGGALIREDNLQLVLATGTLVYLSASEDVLVRRLLRSRTTRPLIQDKNGRRKSETDIRSIIRELMLTRSDQYNLAHIRLSTDELSVRTAVKKLQRLLRDYDGQKHGGSTDTA